MARNRFITRKILGVALLAVGVGLLWWGYQISDSFIPQVTETITGSLPESVMVRYVAGGACIAVGLHLLLRQ